MYQKYSIISHWKIKVLLLSKNPLFHKFPRLFGII